MAARVVKKRSPYALVAFCFLGKKAHLALPDSLHHALALQMRDRAESLCILFFALQRARDELNIAISRACRVKLMQRLTAASEKILFFFLLDYVTQ
jgi:hypothetical protein